MSQFIDTLPWQCACCGEKLSISPRGADCSRCGKHSPFRNGSLDFMGPYTAVEANLEKEAELARQICQILSLPSSALSRVQSAVASSRERTGVSYIDAEIAGLGERFGLSDERREPPMTEKISDPRISILGHFFTRHFTAGMTVYRSFRMLIETGLTIRSDCQVNLAYRWRDARGNHVGGESHRTPFPIDFALGREVTLPVKIVVPPAAGLYELDILPVIEGVRWCDEQAYKLHVEVSSEQLHAEVPEYEQIGDYGADHAAAVTFLREYINGNRTQPVRALEIASGASPHLTPLAEDGHSVLASDICSNLVQLGAIYYDCHSAPDKRARLAFASFDALSPPFPPATFECVAVFAALHHFPDPVAFLVALRQSVAVGGFMAVMCEPCDPSTVSAGYLRDLGAGINEQVFSPEEYIDMFVAAGFSPVSVRNDGGSLKAIIRPVAQPAPPAL